MGPSAAREAVTRMMRCLFSSIEIVKPEERKSKDPKRVDLDAVHEKGGALLMLRMLSSIRVLVRVSLGFC